ncbi:MAG: restriction endonuclease subunit S [Acidobacteria bacterium]|nr:restriction endonuclease subunit S [Acidobacteriota bacterium]
MSENGHIPGDWKPAKFGDFVQRITGGASTKKSDYFDEGVLVLNKGNIKTQGKIEFNKGRVYVTPEYAMKHPKKIIRNGDLVATFRDLSSKADFLGLVGIFDENEDALLTQGAYIVQLDETVDPKFFVYFSNSPGYRSLMKKIKHGSTQVHIRNADFLGVPISLPPLPEQKKIAHILSTVQRAIEAQERIIQTTTELKKALMHKLFTEGLRHEPQKQTEIGPIPEGWETPTVESVCTIKASAMSYSQLEKASNVLDGVRVIGIKVSDMNLPGNEIEFRSANLERLLTEKEARKRTVPADSIIFPKRGAAIATNKKRLTKGYTVLDPNLIAVLPSEAVNHRYLFHWFNTFDLKKITDPGPTPQLNKKDIAPLWFPMPPVEEQEEIVAAIDATEEKSTLHSRKRDQLQDLFRTLLHELMTAKTRVHELELSA